MENKNNLDRLEQYFQNALEQQEDLPSADFWERVEPLIPSPEKKKRRLFFLLFGAFMVIGLGSTLLYSLNARIDAVEKEVVELKGVDNQGIISDIATADKNENTTIKTIPITKNENNTNQNTVTAREEKTITAIEEFDESHPIKNTIIKQVAKSNELISTAPKNQLVHIKEILSTNENISSTKKSIVQIEALPNLPLTLKQWTYAQLQQSKIKPPLPKLLFKGINSDEKPTIELQDLPAPLNPIFSLRSIDKLFLQNSDNFPPPVLHFKKKRSNEFYTSAAVSLLTIGTQLINDPTRPVNSVGQFQYHPTFSLRIGTVLKSRWVIELGGEYKRYFDNISSQNQHTFQVVDAVQLPDGLQGKYTFNLSDSEEDVRVGLTLFQPNGSSTARLEDGDVFNTTVAIKQQIELSRFYLSVGYKFKLNHRFHIIPKIGVGTILVNNFNAKISQVNVQDDALIPQSFTIIHGQSGRGIVSSWQVSLDALYRWKPRWSLQVNATQRVGVQSLRTFQFERANGFFDLNVGLRYHF